MRDGILCIKDILESIEMIEMYVGDKNYDEFIQNQITSDAVVRRLEIIGEASKNIPKNIREKHRIIPWRKIIGMRNRITHAYFVIDLEIVWNIIKEELPELKLEIERILSEMGLVDN